MEHMLLCQFCPVMAQLLLLFSLPGRSPGRAIVLPPASALALAPALAAASALAKSLTLKFFYVMGKAMLGELSCPCDRSCFSLETKSDVQVWLCSIRHYH